MLIEKHFETKTVKNATVKTDISFTLVQTNFRPPIKLFRHYVFSSFGTRDTPSRHPVWETLIYNNVRDIKESCCTVWRHFMCHARVFLLSATGRCITRSKLRNYWQRQINGSDRAQATGSKQENIAFWENSRHFALTQHLRTQHLEPSVRQSGMRMCMTL